MSILFYQYPTESIRIIATWCFAALFLAISSWNWDVLMVTWHLMALVFNIRNVSVNGVTTCHLGVRTDLCAPECSVCLWVCVHVSVHAYTLASSCACRSWPFLAGCVCVCVCVWMTVSTFACVSVCLSSPQSPNQTSPKPRCHSSRWQPNESWGDTLIAFTTVQAVTWRLTSLRLGYI